MKGAWKTVRNKRGSIWDAAAVLLILVPLALEAGGCQGGLKPVEWSELGSDNKPQKQSPRSNAQGLRVMARSNREVAKLSPKDIVRVMQRVGFSDEQILELGTDLYNALLLSGGAEVYYGKRLEMMFAVNRQQVHIQSSSRGTFVYDIAAGQFVLGSASSGKSR
jgi:hypothetical protein